MEGVNGRVSRRGDEYRPCSSHLCRGVISLTSPFRGGATRAKPNRGNFRSGYSTRGETREGANGHGRHCRGVFWCVFVRGNHFEGSTKAGSRRVPLTRLIGRNDAGLPSVTKQRSRHRHGHEGSGSSELYHHRRQGPPRAMKGGGRRTGNSSGIKGDVSRGHRSASRVVGLTILRNHHRCPCKGQGTGDRRGEDTHRFGYVERHFRGLVRRIDIDGV